MEKENFNIYFVIYCLGVGTRPQTRYPGAGFLNMISKCEIYSTNLSWVTTVCKSVGAENRKIKAYRTCPQRAHSL